MMQQYRLTPAEEHSFTWYVEQCGFKWMMHEAGLTAAPDCDRPT
jgi:hypothetical protein